MVKETAIGLALIVTGAAAGFITLTAEPTAVKGYARVIDGDTIEIRETRIRLWGIDAPEINTPRGRLAKKMLYVVINDNEVVCFGTGWDRYKRLVARCYVQNQDIARWMLRFKMAREWCRYSKGYYGGCKRRKK